MPGLASRTVPSPLGTVTVVAAPTGLRAVLFPGRVWPPEAEAPTPSTEAMADEAAGQLAAWFAGERHEFDLPLDLAGPAFSVAVWQALAGIPYGATVSYGELARRVGRPGAARAVGGAVGRNPVPIVLPCHRVIGAGGALTGFGGGLDSKRWLLGHEAAAVEVATG